MLWREERFGKSDLGRVIWAVVRWQTRLATPFGCAVERKFAPRL